MALHANCPPPTTGRLANPSLMQRHGIMRGTRAYAERLRPLERDQEATDAADEDARLYFCEGEIWWVRMGHNIGYEANGKGRPTRPTIILKKYNQYSFQDQKRERPDPAHQSSVDAA